MKTKKLFVAAMVTLASLGTGVANATTYNLSGLQSGPLINPSSFTATVNSSVADPLAALDFVLTGFHTLDGNNSYQDLLTLTINGTLAGSGSFNLGGGGSSDLFFGSGTATTLNQLNADPGTGIGTFGGTTTVTGLTFNLLAGNNNFEFAYTAPGIDNGFGGQGLEDEGWGIASASVTAVPVPEPETYAMMLAGLGLIGFMARRRRNKG